LDQYRNHDEINLAKLIFFGKLLYPQGGICPARRGKFRPTANYLLVNFGFVKSGCPQNNTPNESAALFNISAP